MARTKAATLEVQMPNINIHDFWKKVEEWKRSRGMSYQDMVDAGRKVGVTIDRSTIKQAIKFNRKPSTEMLSLVAAAFDIPIAEVYKAAGIFTEIPRDVVDSRPLVLQVLEYSQQMTDAELEQVIALQKIVIDQKRRQHKTNGKTRR